MTAVIDHLMDSYERELSDRLTATNAEWPTTAERLTAYLDWVCDGHFDSGDLVMFTDSRLREPLTEHWKERMSVWVNVPDAMAGKQRARLHSVRLIADGIWINAASNGIPLSTQDRDAVRALGQQLIEEIS